MILYTNNQSGQSLLEVLIAMSIFVVGVATIGFLVLDANVATRQGVERTQATLLAREGLEAARSIRDADFDNLTAGTHGIALVGNTWTFSGSSDTQDQFTRTVQIGPFSTSTIDATDIVMATSTVTWQFSDARQNSVILTEHMTDWNQTQGDGEFLLPNIANAVIEAGQADKQIKDITIENTNTSSAITITHMTLWWDNATNLTRIRIDNANVYNDQSIGTASGIEIDIDDVVLAASSGNIDIDALRWKDSIVDTDVMVKYLLSDGSNRWMYLQEPGSETGGGQSDNLSVDVSSVAIDGSDNTKVVGITISNTGESTITLDTMTVSWTGAPGGTKINEITIDGTSQWTGNDNSGNVQDITDFVLSAGQTYSINSLDFNKNMTSTTLSIVFTMSDSSSKTISDITP
jgi:Tfp pilus assembly protein PilV